MKLVKHLLDRKGRHIIGVKPQDTVLDAIRLMAEKNIGAVVVLEEGRLLGIMSERDYARKVIVKGRASNSTPVADIMTAEVLTTSGDETVNACMEAIDGKKDPPPAGGRRRYCRGHDFHRRPRRSNHCYCYNCS